MLNLDQKRLIMKKHNKGMSKAAIARHMEIDRKTVGRYLLDPLKPPAKRSRTRPDPLEQWWSQIKALLKENPGLQAGALLGWLESEHQVEGLQKHLRTLQRRIKEWRATSGPPKEVFFTREHRPGKTLSPDFSHMDSLGVTIQGKPYQHMICHVVMTHSNWEWARIVQGETLEGLRAGLLEGLMRLGKLPEELLTDSLTAAVRTIGHRQTFQGRYTKLVEVLGMRPVHTTPSSPEQNGDNERAHGLLKSALQQHLMLRGSRDFASREEYVLLLQQLMQGRNRARQKRLDEELAVMRPLPTLMPEHEVEHRTVSVHSTVSVKSAVYSVPSNLIGEMVEVRLYDDKVEVWFAGRKQMCAPRVMRRQAHIDWKHLAIGLRGKPGAFQDFRYREAMYPSSVWRMAHEQLEESCGIEGTRIYLEYLVRALEVGLDRMTELLQSLQQQGIMPSRAHLEKLPASAWQGELRRPDVAVAEPDLELYAISYVEVVA